MVRKTGSAFARRFTGSMGTFMLFALFLALQCAGVAMALENPPVAPLSQTVTSGAGFTVDPVTGTKTFSYLKRQGEVWSRVTRGDGARENVIVPAAQPDLQNKGVVNSEIFAPYIKFDVGSEPEAVAIGDLNGDGLNDVVMTTSYYFDPDNDYRVFVFLQNASHQLAAPVKYAAGNGESVDIGDLNHDGRVDLVVTTRGGIGVLYQNAAGGFNPMVVYPSVNNSSRDTSKLRIGDFNNDGLKDVVAIYWGSQSQDVEIYLQNASGTLNPPVSYTVLHGGYDDLKVGDVNNDGLLDIIVMSGQSYEYNNVGILLQQLNGTFGSPVYYDLGGDVNSSGVAVGDVNGDNLQDVVVSFGGNKPDSKIGVFLQNASGTLNPPIIYSSYDIPEAIEIRDVNGDGKNDVVVAHGGWTSLGVYLQNAGGSLAAELLDEIPYASHYNTHGLRLGDINGDGGTDAVIADYNHGLVVLYNNQGSPVTSVTLESYKVSPQPIGTSVTFTASASGGAAPVHYQFWLLPPGGAWALRQAYGSAPSWSWNTSGLAAGTYTVMVWAKGAGSTASYEAYKTVTYTLMSPASSVTLTPSLSSPRPVGTNVTFTAAASGGSGSYQYQFWLKNTTGTWSIVRAYSPTPTWTWATTGLPAGTYGVQVWAKNTGSSAGYEAYKAITYTLTVSPASSVTLTPSLSSPRPVGTSVTFTAAASGGSGSYQYQFWLKNTAGTWSIVRAYGSTPTWTWATAGLPAGTYGVQVWAKNTGSSASYEAYKAITYALTVAPAGTVTLTPSVSSPRPVGTSVTFTAAASGGSGSYQYQFWLKNTAGTWSIVRSYSSTPTWTWATTGLPAGTYGVQVWAKNTGSSASYEAYKNISYILQ